MFRNRMDAGEQLALKLKNHTADNCIIYAIPRGGVPVAHQIAIFLNKPLELLIVRKLGSPWEEELALGAVTEGDPPSYYLEQGMIRSLGMDATAIDDLIRSRKKEIERMQLLFRHGRKMLTDPNATAIIVDDGIATGSTVKAAVRFLRNIDQKRIVVAAPVADQIVVDELEKLADEVVCVNVVHGLYAVGEYYRDFSQLSDEEVMGYLR